MENSSKYLREVVRELEQKLCLVQEDELACCGITFSQCHALIEIGRNNDISLNKLVEILKLEKSTLSRTVNSLVVLGYVKREIHQMDRRYVSINLTESGLELYKCIEDEMNLYFDKIFNSISENKRLQVIESIKILLDAIKAIS